MSRRSLYVLVLVGLFAWSAPPVQAQGTTQTQAFSQGVTVKADGKTVDNSTKVYVNRKQCKEPATYEFTVTLTGNGAVQGTQVPVLEVWGSNQSGLDCSTADNRKSGTNNTKSQCYLVWRSPGSGSAIRVGYSNKVSVTAGQLFQNNGTRDGKCDLSAPAPTTVSIYFVPLTAATPSNTGNATAPMNNAAVSTAIFTLFTVLPASPTGISGGDGETQLTAKWSDVDIGGTMKNYKVYFDWGAPGTGTPSPAEDGGASTEKDAGTTKDSGTNNPGTTTDSGTTPTTDAGTNHLIDGVTQADTAACGSGALLAGRDPPETNATLDSIGTSGTSASLKSLDSKKIALNQFVAAAVVTVDAAGNESVLSQVVCIQRIKTNGFWDQCKDDPKCNKSFDSCSAQPWRHARFPLTALCLSGGALLYWRRRRRNV